MKARAAERGGELSRIAMQCLGTRSALPLRGHSPALTKTVALRQRHPPLTVCGTTRSPAMRTHDAPRARVRSETRAP